MSTRLLRKRPSRIGPAVVVALILLLLAVGLGWAGIAAFASFGTVAAGLIEAPESGIAEAAGNLHWNSAPVIAVGVTLALLGLIALILGVSPGARRILGVRADGAEHIGDFEVALPLRRCRRSRPQLLMGSTASAESRLRRMRSRRS